MRRVAQREDIDHFITALARRATNQTRLYFTGGATAVLLGWRASTIDANIHIVPEDDRLLRALPELKQSLELNVELACPAHFIPELPGWQERSLFITQEEKLSFSTMICMRRPLLRLSAVTRSTSRTSSRCFVAL